MQQRFAARSGRQAAVYRIVVRGEIVRPLVGPLEHMSVELGGEIVSVNPADEPGH